MTTCFNVEYWVDIIAYLWDIFKYLIVYVGIYINLCPCMNVKRQMNLRGKPIIFKKVNIHQHIHLKHKHIQFMKLLIYYWSSKYIDKDFDTFICLLDKYISELSKSSFTLFLNIEHHRHDMQLNIDLINRTVQVVHISNQLLICTHTIDDSYGFDLLDILDFAIGRSKCPLI